MKNALADVIAERCHQIMDLNYNVPHDDQHDQRELARAAASYLRHYIYRTGVPSDTYFNDQVAIEWPWDEKFWNPQDPRADLVRTAALIIAEIERIDRAEEYAKRRQQ